PAGATLDILVENLGRINFGAKLAEDHKGISRSVKLGQQELLDWSIYSLPLAQLDRLQATLEVAGGPVFFRGQLKLDKPVDSFLDTRGWGRGQVWVNGRLLGRFWHIGPQQTLYLPAAWLKAGDNQVTLLTHQPPAHELRLQGLANPVFDTPGIN
ncbi:MAG TPA: beta galactosidase jelly roll domain-containing protein, partial [Burkholderiaceae bacterium]